MHRYGHIRDYVSDAGDTIHLEGTGKYMEKKEDREGYNMCQAIREWAEEERSIGFAEGQQTGEDKKTRTIVRNMLLGGMADADIMAIAECDQKLIEKVRMEL